MTRLLRGGGAAIAVVLIVLVVPVTLLRGGISSDERREQGALIQSLTQGLAAAETLKARIATYYESRGTLPDGSSVLDAAARDAIPPGVAVGEHGVITVAARGTTGETAGTVRLLPVMRGTGSRVQWRCVTADFRNIRKHFPQCRYEKATPAG